MTRKLLTLLCLLSISLVLSCTLLKNPKKEITVSIKDDAPFHVHTTGSKSKISVRISAPPNTTVTYFWQDFTKTALTLPQKISVNNSSTILSLPFSQTGYYGLVFQTTSSVPFENRQIGETREYGFSVLPQQKKQNASSPFGTVHADINDPYLPPWVKTTTWQTTSAGHWPELMGRIKAEKKSELPLILGALWESDDSKIISAIQLDSIYQNALSYFKADPTISYWEAGLEENLRNNYQTKYYWENLEKKFKSLRKASNAAGADIQFIYQIVGADTPGIRTFFENKAYRFVDIISLHPYAWPDFPSPDLWLENLMDEINQLQMAHHSHLPLWLTEIGAPHFGNYEGGFFGYPKKNNKTGGLSKKEAVNFITKLCVLARAHNIEKIFWYNYQDHSPSREEVEAHFGLRDYKGFPKPVYAAYNQITQLLEDAKGTKIANLPQGVKGFVFKKEGEQIFVLWRKTNETLPFSLSPLNLEKGIVTDAVGHPVPVKNGNLNLGDLPLFIRWGS